MACTNKVIDLARKNQWPIWTLLTVTAIVASLWVPQLAAQFGRDQSVGRTLQLALYPWGFEPDEATVSAGPIAIEMLNRVGFPELQLHIEQDQGPDKAKVNLLTDRFEAETPRWRNVFVLTPGSYLVSVEPHAKWIARITVTDDGVKR